MANAPINKPALFQGEGQSWAGKMRPAQTDGSNTFTAGEFVALTSGALVAMASDGIYIYGLVLDPSHTATDEPYTAPFGQFHNVIDPTGGVKFLMNISDSSGNEGSGSTTHTDVTIGHSYSGILGATSTTTMFVNKSDGGTLAVADRVFKVEALYNAATYGTGDAAADYNGRVVVSIVPAAIQ